MVVTGAAEGIARLALWDVSKEACAATAAECSRLGAPALWRRVDVGEPDQIEAAAVAAIEFFGTVYGLVNNAGIFPRSAILESSPDLWRSVLAVNLLGTVFCSQALGREMIARKRGAVVNIASGRALQGTPRGAHYAASKAAILSFTKSFAAPHGIRANAVIPGVTETAQPLADTTLEELHARGARIPLGRIGQPEDIAGVVAFLFSDAAAYMTGQSVVVNGGAIMVP